MRQLMKMPVTNDDIKSPSDMGEAINDAINMAFGEILRNYIPIEWLEKEYLGEIRRAGCMPRSEVVKEIIERWRGETGE